jgi:tetratricopeptide (TPR) repeat protein
MNLTLLIVDLTPEKLGHDWQERLTDIPMVVRYAATSEHALSVLNESVIVPMIVIAKDSSPELTEILRNYSQKMGFFANYQAIVCSDPSPKFMAMAFDYGIENFVAQEQWYFECAAIARSILEKLDDPESPESKAISLAVSLQSKDQTKISAAKAALSDLTSYDFRAAYFSGRASEAAGNFEEALESYRQAAGMNKMFRPSATSLGEACFMLGKVDEAIAVFQTLDRTNPYDIDRKGNLASAFIEKGDFEKAAEHLKFIETAQPNSTRALEVRAHEHLAKGQIAEALKVMDHLSNVGPIFAAKLNDFGIKLSQLGKGKVALALYQKAHRIVRPDLRYKISINAALACRRLKEFDMALKYVERCAKEYGGMFAKLEKIRETLLAERSAHIAQKAG